ncbi:MAG: helix-turn-helix transcriptional regulator [Planctomycetota bacterium]|nr:helix-turn-helix transcriptional regulator [Planctomycetota bacterium]
MPRSLPIYKFSPSKARRRIEQAGLTITLAAAHLKLSTNTVGRWFTETGRRTQPKIGNCRRLATLLKCKMEDLTERE